MHAGIEFEDFKGKLDFREDRRYPELDSPPDSPKSPGKLFLPGDRCEGDVSRT